MRDYAELVKGLRDCSRRNARVCMICGAKASNLCEGTKSKRMFYAADAIEELLRIGAKIHTWIFLHTTDEQAAYDETGLTNEQNALFGYSGQIILKAAPPKEEKTDA